MNTRLLKAKRVEYDISQKQMAELLGITEKTYCVKENSAVNRFSADEMLAMATALRLSLRDFDAIFFSQKLTETIGKHNQ